MTAPVLTPGMIREWLPRRRADAHKGDYGHVLIVAGSRGMAGAGVLAAHGALRGGSGLVTLAVPKSLWKIAAEKLRPEAMVLPLPETGSRTLWPGSVESVVRFLERRKVSAMAMGPGLSLEPSARAFAKRLIDRAGRLRLLGLVLDADGFLALAPGKRLKNSGAPIAVTPHPGEMARFLGIPTSAVQSSRVQTSMKFAKLNGVVCVLKGSGTIVTDGKTAYRNPTGNPGMATGGSGDVLAGLIAALIPQVRPGPEGGILRAAAAGAYLHGLAGDLARDAKTEIAMVAGDVAEMIPLALQTLFKGRKR